MNPVCDGVNALYEYQMYPHIPRWYFLDGIQNLKAGRYLLANPVAKDYPMESAYLQHDGRWTKDREGRFEIDFVPMYAGELPQFPPYPPPHLMPKDHPLYRPLFPETE